MAMAGGGAASREVGEGFPYYNPSPTAAPSARPLDASGQASTHPTNRGHCISKLLQGNSPLAVGSTRANPNTQEKHVIRLPIFQ